MRGYRHHADTADRVAFLALPATHGVCAVEVRETHAAWVFLAGDRAYKLKKAVRLPHHDYSTLAARELACKSEVRLNRRLAPDIYLHAEPLTHDPEAGFAIGGAGRAVDWLVVMRRLPAPGMLDAAIRALSVIPDDIERVADRLCDFYRQAPRVVMDPGAVAARFDAGLAAGEAVFANPGVGPAGARGLRITAALREIVQDRPDLLEERAQAGVYVEGHGDLRPEHVHLGDPPLFIDCLEFSRDLRLVDPFDEFSFLGMECAVLGARWIGPMLLSRGAGLLGGRPPDVVLALYVACRATLRARQAAAHLCMPQARTPELWLPRTRGYLDEAGDALAALLRHGVVRSSTAFASRPRTDPG